MATVLCYGDSNTWGCPPQTHRGLGGRFAPDQRWPGVLAARLGPGHEVVAEGLGGRTTCIDDPVDGHHKNGATFLPVALESHNPLDLVVIMLGTNDLKARFAMQPCDIAEGAGRLAQTVQRSGSGRDGASPRVLLVCPPPLVRMGWFAEMFEGGTEKSHRLAPAMAEAAARYRAAFFDAGSVITCSEGDGIHLDEAAQRRLGEALAEVVADLIKGF